MTDSRPSTPGQSTPGQRTPGQRTPGQSTPGPLGRLEALTIVCVIGVLALALGIVALITPTTAVTARAVDYTQSGTFDYSAHVPSSSLYGDAGLTTGDPIATSVVTSARVRFRYRFDGAGVAGLHGTASLSAIVSFGNGLSRTFPMAPKSSFTGPTATVAGTLPVTEIEAYARTVSRQLGAGSPFGVTVSIQPTVAVTGSVSGQVITADYSPPLPFGLTGTLMTLTKPTGSSSSADPIHPSAHGSTNVRVSEPNSVPLLVIHPSVPMTRYVALSIAGLCLLVGLWLARPLLARRSPSAEGERIRAVYGSRLIPVEGYSAPAAAVADVASMESLAQIAKRYESVIMHLSEAGRDDYLVWDSGILYRYRADPPSEASEVRDRASSARHAAGPPGDGTSMQGETADSVDVLVRELLEQADRGAPQGR